MSYVGTASCLSIPHTTYHIPILAADVHHGAIRLNKIGLINTVAGLFLVNRIDEKSLNIAVHRSIANQMPHVILFHREQTSTQLAVGGQANPAALPAKGDGNRRNNPNFALSIREAITQSGFAGRMSRRLEQGKDRVDGRDDF